VQVSLTRVDAQSSDFNEELITNITRCLADSNHEAVLFQTEFFCRHHKQTSADQKNKIGDGHDFFQNEKSAPKLLLGKDEDVEKICNDPNDQRRLSSNAIKKIAAQKIDPLGIRIVGAIFCESVDLAGLDLQYSVVMDFSFLRKGIEARNFRTRGDLIFDNSVIFGTFSVRRSQIGGTLQAEDALVERLEMLDSQVQGSLLFRKTLFFKPVVLDTISLSGELSLRSAMFPYFLLQYAKVGGVLDLTYSQAGCAYVLRKNEIQDMVAYDFGSSAREHPTLLEAAHEDRIAGEKLRNTKCEYSAIASPATFLIADTHVRSSLCVRSFNWLRPASNEASYLSLDDVNVDKSTLIDLSPETKGPSRASDEKHKFELVDLETHSFITSFEKGPDTYETWANGLKFEHVYLPPSSPPLDAGSESATKDRICGYDPSFSASYNVAMSLLQTGRDAGEKPQLAGVDEVMAWLGRNKVGATQPFEAFVGAFQRDGRAADARLLRIRKADQELYAKTSDVYTHLSKLNVANIHSSAIQHPFRFISNALLLFSDLVALSFAWLLSVVADHGYRPEKVSWIVVLTVLLATAYFRYWLGIVAFMPAKKNTIRPIGLAFVFDRMLPAYRIRDEHYDIDTYFKRVSTRQIRRGEIDSTDIKASKYICGKVRIVKADAKDVQRFELCLDMLKILGLALAIFLVAAVNALVSH
jgi:hypothetical protein